MPVSKRIMIALWRLATNIEYRSLARMFKIGISTACGITLEFTEAVATILLPIYVKIPQGEQFRNVTDGFYNKFGLIQCGGAIDGTHIPILAPKDHHTDYFNRKGWHSVVVQGVIDHNYMFMDINSGWPGSVHDARIFSHSGIYEKGMNKTLFPDYTEDVGGIQVPIYLIADPAYPLLPWVMKPYPRNGYTAEEEYFNYRLSSARMVVENAFGRLKGRWRCLLKRHDGDIKYLNNTISACVTLHNICERHKERFDEQWLVEVQQADTLQPAHAQRNVAADNDDRDNAVNIRTKLKKLLGCQ